MTLNSTLTELTTGFTDGVLAVLALILMIILWRARHPARWKITLWCSVFGLLALASVLGAVVHTFEWSAPTRWLIWQPLYMILSLTVALFVVGGVYDLAGERTARGLVPWAVALSIGFYLLTLMLDRGFIVFIIYEAIAMVGAFLIYLRLARRGNLPGAALIALAILLNMIAAGIQSSSLSLILIVPFDHNGLFHLVQYVVIIILARGLLIGLRRDSTASSAIFGQR